jgi:hypothetical protein
MRAESVRFCPAFVTPGAAIQDSQATRAHFTGVRT